MIPGLFFAALLGLLVSAAPGVHAQPTGDPPLDLDHAAPPLYDMPDFERRVLDEVNRLRVEEGRRAVSYDPRLAEIARAHSQDMLDRGFVAHRSPDGRAPGERALRAGYRFYEFGENLFWGRLYDTLSHTSDNAAERMYYRWHSPEELVALIAAMWMESPGHRENMLAGRYDFGGIGAVIGPDFDIYVTLNLSAR